MSPEMTLTLTRRVVSERRRGAGWLVALLLIATALEAGCRRKSETARDATITVYGFSIIDEPLKMEIFPAFKEEWQRKTGQTLTLASSVGGSEVITNQILSGVECDLAILAIDRNADRLLKLGATKSNWRELPHQGIVHTTPMVILVRAGNPKRIRDFRDLAQPGLKIIHPDPISSGAGQWSLLAIYGSEMLRSERETGRRDETKAFELLNKVWRNVIATPAAARDARTQFERGEGDALVTYELEALELLDKKAPFEIVAPSSTIFSEHPVVIIDHGMSPAKYALVELFARYLWSEPAQRVWVKHYFRSVTDERLNAEQPRFARIEHPFKVAEFGGWERAYDEIVDRVWKQRIQSAK
jgi:sulfate transport system substrate-binding protein